ncbi:calmodulin-binding transcription activator 4 isoform X1 [Rosa rugosa]|uniref:calmodulin-binding transcription activator 4 isoform X1 n=2 Tax=Rosa rugosa TaxID=74645 RepID=UPI002B40BFE3|nr:calmodulin-binding transcription activator 4 isoform X1 [Rosa rugosa]
MQSGSGYNINDLFQEAQSRWLKPAEVLFILQNHEKYKVTPEPPQQPVSGSLFLFNKRILRFFRRDGHRWRKKKDGRTVGEAHERLKVGNVETLNCYYAHGEDNPNFQRRSYWMLDPAYEHIVLVHYREISEVKPGTGSFIQSPVSSSSLSQSPISNTTQHPGSVSMISELYEPYTSPGSVEVSSDLVIKKNGRESVENLYRTGESDSSSKADVSQALRRLEEQLSLNDDSFNEFVDDNPDGSDIPEYPSDQFTAFHGQDHIVHDQFYSGHSLMQGNADNSSDILDYHNDIVNQDQFTPFHGPEHIVNDQFYSGRAQMQSNVDLSGKHHQLIGHEFADGNKESASWKEVLNSSKTSSVVEPQETGLYTLDRNEKLSSSLTGPNGAFEYPSLSRPQEVDIFKSPFSSAIETHSDYFTSFFEQGQMGNLESDISLTVAQTQKFTIREISPEWGDANEPTKVIVIGSFLCDPSESAWTCMFGNVEVPAQIIQEGVIRCEAPPHLPGKVTLCITLGNRESCSEVREFEYRDKSSRSTPNNSPPKESSRSAEELLLLVRFAQILLSDSSVQKRDTVESEFVRKSKADDDTWGSIIEALLVGSGSSSSTIYWLLEEFLKDKLEQWLSSRSQGLDQTDCSLSRKEQGMIHMVAGLGFEWALNPILDLGVNINFRDINGWTALHWAARFGREKMVAVLVASGASAGAVTDPNSQDPIGKTPASIAAIHGHKGLAGYLSEVALTSHLSSLTLEESEISRGCAEIEAEKTVNSISKSSLETNEDQAPLKNTLAAVRNAAQAAARIQSAFRAHSFRRRQQKDAGVTIDDYGISSDDILGLSAMSKLNFRNPRDYNSAALSIQKKYRGWKGRKDFLALRKKVVKIQAHVRGYQVRKHYKVICWAVGILDKVVLRWRRKGVGLRGFRHEAESTESSEDEDILKVFRKQKVDGAIDEAVSRVLSMVESPEAREQYQRMLEGYHQAKAELGGTSGEAGAPISLEDFVNMEDIDMYQFQ